MNTAADCGITGETLVDLSSGHRVPIRDLVGTRQQLAGVSGEKLATGGCGRIDSSGTKPVLKLTLASGRQLRATADQRLHGADGPIAMSKVIVDGRIGICRRMCDPNSGKRWNDHELVLLGHLVGDGSYLRGAPLRYTTASDENANAVREAAIALGSTIKRYEGRGRWHQLLISGNGNRWHAAGVGKWLKQLGIFGQRSHEKRLPADVFGLPDEQVALLLRHLWATDGCIHVRHAGQKGASRVYFSTSSQMLAHDVGALLLRFGIVARLRKAVTKQYRPCYTVDVSGAQQATFVDRIGAFGPRLAPADALRVRLSEIKSNTNVDTLPLQAFAEVRNSMAIRGISIRQLAQERGVSPNCIRNVYFSPSRELIREYARVLEDRSLLHWCESDLFWDRVVGVEPDGSDAVYGVEMDNGQYWLADGVPCMSKAH